MKIFDANVLTGPTISNRGKQNCNLSRANIGLLVHVTSQNVYSKVQTQKANLIEFKTAFVN